DYLASLEWIPAAENLCLVGPPGTGKSHVLVSLGISAVCAGHKVRYFTAADLVDAPYRGLADNSAGKVIENLLRNDLILVDEVGSAPWPTPPRSCCSGWSPRPTNGGPSGWQATGPSTSGAGSCPSTPPRSASWTACSTTRTSSSPTATPTACAKPEREEEHASTNDDQPEGWGLLTGHKRGPQRGHGQMPAWPQRPAGAGRPGSRASNEIQANSDHYRTPARGAA